MVAISKEPSAALGRPAAELSALRPTVVVPCYNEAARLDTEGFRRFLRTPGVRLVFVDDGSTDETAGVLERFVGAIGPRARFLQLASNVGKAEAVRRGMLAALEDGSELVGYFDADLATPPEEMCRLMETLSNSEAQLALAARVGLLGTRITRKRMRHYSGRVFATAASMILDLRVYDTQCGAKAFRRSPQLLAALAEPFHARWAFDVELLGRLLTHRPGLDALGEDELFEMPLTEWTDVGDSKLRPHHWPLMGVELVRIKLALARWGRTGTPSGTNDRTG